MILLGPDEYQVNHELNSRSDEDVGDVVSFTPGWPTAILIVRTVCGPHVLFPFEEVGCRPVGRHPQPNSVGLRSGCGQQGDSSSDGIAV